MLIRVLKNAFLQVPGSKFFFPKDAPNNPVVQGRHNTLQGIPSVGELKLNWVDWIPNGSHVGFSPVTGKDAEKQYPMTRRLINDYEYGLRFHRHIYYRNARNALRLQPVVWVNIL
ncbi:hypothetical protein AC578_302 [Pseudocercospora eumusae]|uniref:Uncharacterized protein n=1 Tax=Pseudocercospora eumusae TaxID=321146 RepID=A0A139HU34_9PEZI|nr:hypothetical protein AC578_302 [Pseudocercospora eumusae]KXT05982.1 hypothetical protein AC578_302 [Pseudocercospora eumusae]